MTTDTTMRAFLCSEFGSPEGLTIGEVPIPEFGPDQVLIKVHAWGVNSTDLVIIAGRYHQTPPRPFIPGMEVAGEIVKVGENVTRFRPGDRVASVGPGGYADYVVAHEGGLFPIPDNMGLAEAAGFTVCYSTAYVALAHRAKLQAGETLLVTGAAGGAGLTAVAIGKRLGANVIAAASTAEKLALAGRFGAASGVNYKDEELAARVRALTGERGVEVVYETVGGDIFDKGLDCIAFEGRFLVIGFASMQFPEVSAARILFGGYSLVASSLYNTFQFRPDVVRQMFADLATWHAEGALPSLVTREMPFEQAPEALAALASRASLGRISLVR